MKLKELVDEEIKKLILEYADSRESFMRDTNGLMKQIIENLVLIIYFRIIGEENENLNHWSSELLAHCGSLCSCRIKKGDSSRIKYKAFLEILNNYKTSDLNSVYNLVKEKLNRENIHLDFSLMEEIHKILLQKLNELNSIISKGDGVILKRYIFQL